MTEAERRRRVEDICDAALLRDEGDRATFVATVCDGDEGLRNEVEALLLHAQSADKFLTASIGEVAADILDVSASRPGGVATASLPSTANDVKRSRAALQDDDTPTAKGPIDDKPIPPERYALVQLHATGGIGRVWLARDTAFGRDVALKELRPEHAELDTHRTRFVQEARITGQLEHPGIVPVYELAARSPEQQPFYAMRFVKGRTLAEAARSYYHNRTQGRAGMLDLVPLLSAFVTVCNTVAYAHSRGVIHRDLKGENVVLGDFGEVVVLDWGLAKLVDQVQGDPILIDDVGSSESGLTQDGQMMGTPAYMAPEQASGRMDLIDRRTDVYGLGAILHEVLTGSPPFSGSDTDEILRKVRDEQPLPMRERWAGVPPALEGICLRALAKNPDDRFASASELATAVQNFQEIARREAQEELDRFFMMALDLLCIGNYDGYFVRVNPAFERTLGFTTDELLSQPWISFVHPDDRERTIAAAASIIDDTVLSAFENRYRCKDGSYKWLQWTAKGYKSATFPARGLIYAVARDVTYSKKAEEASEKG